MTLYLRVGEPTWLTMDLTWVSWVLGGSDQKLNSTEIYKKNFNPIQPESIMDQISSQILTHVDNSHGTSFTMSKKH